MSNEQLAMNREQGIKSGIFTLLFVSCYMLLVLACSNPFEPPRMQNPADVDGEGYFSLQINSGGRTIMPQAALEGNLFDGYTLVFSDAGSTAITIERNKNDINTVITLPVGTWNLEVTACVLNKQTKTPLARGSIAGIVITKGSTASMTIELTPIASGGTGTFMWDITLPNDIVKASLSITPLDAGGSAGQTLWLEDKTGVNTVTGDNVLELNSGIYRLALTMNNGAVTKTREEFLHIYQNMESAYTDDFTGVFVVIPVTSEADDNTAGTLRKAIADAPAYSMIYIADNVKTISLASNLYINKSLVIEGNGVTITCGANFNNRLLYIDSSAVVNISRIHFKNGRGYQGGAIFNQGTLIVESCIFSDNQASSTGGAIHNHFTMTVTGCTFYNNSSNSGGAIWNHNYSLIFTGNLFYGNTAVSYPVIYNGYSNTNSSGYNVVDVALGPSDTQAGWTTADTDITISNLPISGATFKLLAGSGAKNVITTLPAGYPSTDFYGNPINNGAAAGAVQASVSGSGYYLDFSINNPTAGTVNVSPAPDADGLRSGTTTLTATAETGYSFGYWLVNGVKQSGSTLTVTSHTKIVAVFTRLVMVTSSEDANTDGTLRYALNNAQNGDIISISGITTIELTGQLPTLNNSVTIEGNGVTITRSPSWTYTGSLLQIESGTVNISRMHFKGGRGNYGGAIYNHGILTVESCIFSDNQAGSSSGAIYNGGTLTVTGCTFYNNIAVRYYGGAIYNDNGLTLTGNLFYGNTGPQYPVVVPWGTQTSGGYNVVDVAFGYGYAGCGWTAADTDATLSSLPISGATFKLLAGSEAAGVITTLPAGYPSQDFYGNPINNGAAAGAVQASVSGSGYYLELSRNNDQAGTVNVSPAPDADGLSFGTTTLTAVAETGYSFGYWLVNGSKQSGATLTVTGQTKVVAVFTRAVTVTSSTDTNTVGTLRYALNNAQDGDIISINVNSTIELTNQLSISKSVTIEGNGVVITRQSNINNTSLIIEGRTMKISRIHFKGLRGNGAIENNRGDITIESCIFSGNQGTSSGGAIYNYGTMTITGCTFYENIGNTGGAIYHSEGSLTLTGNLFYGNTTSNSNNYPIITPYSTTISGGYNVVDVAYGTYSNQCGWTAVTGDTTFEDLGISGVPFDTNTFVPVNDLRNVMPLLPIEDFPTTDFNGATRTWPGAAGAIK
jgi:hypothetical protein